MKDKYKRNLAVILLFHLLLAALASIFWGLWGLLTTGILFLMLWVGLGAAFFFMILYRQKGVLSNIGPRFGMKKSTKEETQAFICQSEAKLAPIGWEDVYVVSEDNLRLHGYFIPAPQPGETRTVVLFHGYSVRALQMADYALYWRDTFGFNVLMPDARAHGLSQGRIAGMSWPERKDCQLWLNFLRERLGPTATFALHGISMGGSTVLTAAGEEPQDIKILIEDCGYSSVYEEFKHQLQRRLYLPSWPLLPFVSLLCKGFAGYTFKEASPIGMAKKIQLPILVIHGQADTFVPCAMGQQIYDALPSPDKELVLVPDAGHIESFAKDQTGAIRARIAQMVQQYMTNA